MPSLRNMLLLPIKSGHAIVRRPEYAAVRAIARKRLWRDALRMPARQRARLAHACARANSRSSHAFALSGGVRSR